MARKAKSTKPAGATSKAPKKRLHSELENDDPNQQQTILPPEPCTPTKQTGGRSGAEVEYSAKKTRKRTSAPTTAPALRSPGLLSRSSHANTLSSRGLPPKAQKIIRENEADHQVENMLCANIPEILQQARPHDEARSELAVATSEYICTDLEWRISKGPNQRVLRLRKRAKGKQPDTATSTTNDDSKLAALLNSMGIAAANEPSAELEGKLAAEFSEFQPWVFLSASSGKQNERQSYPWIQHFHLYIAHLVRHYLGSVQYGENPATASPRLLLPYKRTDTKYKGSDDDTRADIGLVSRSVGANVAMVDGSAYYNEVFAVTEVKASSGPSRAASTADSGIDTSQLDGDTKQAFKQLFLYSRQVFAEQPDRRFMWGITICDNHIRACVLTSSGALASHEMDITTAKGRCDYIQLLVNWCLCDWHQLGFDPSVRYCEDERGNGYWEIDVPQMATGDAGMESAGSRYETQTYTITGARVAADHLFGRHTRCFVATPKQSTGNQGEVLIKDSWSYLGRHQIQERSGELGEIAFLTKINQMVDEHPEFAGTVPRLEDGGIVRLDVNGHLAIDSVETVLGDLCRHLPKHSSDYAYTHVRLAMTPVGTRLRELRSVAELVVVISDALQAHKAVLDHCQILHRDISENNIMFTRSGNNIHGMLIDFDNAVDANAARNRSGPVCTGTLPFMSVNNLRKAKVARTAVDDMESILYLLIWLGVWGITTEHRKQTRGGHRRVVNWSMDVETAIDSKQLTMSSKSNLDKLLNEFYTPPMSELDSTLQAEDDETIEDYEDLQIIVEEMREAIFDNPNVPGNAKGTTIRVDNTKAPAKTGRRANASVIKQARRPIATSKGNKPEPVDSFEERAKPDIAKKIHEDVVGLLKFYADRIRSTTAF
ncbi:hypothetical protein BX667DRAFT_537708 [Coemansia mojavensis]|nr:hypothetical protein BX667DRAFT_537708 [Coemansia mojavensis]